VPIARAINPDLRIFVNTPFASEADSLRSMGVEGAFSGEREVALSMSRFLLDDLGGAYRPGSGTGTCTRSLRREPLDAKKLIDAGPS